MEKVGRNALCLCGSGQKHKLCCLDVKVIFSPPLEPDMLYGDFDVDISAFEALSHLDKKTLSDWVNVSDSIQKINNIFQGVC